MCVKQIHKDLLTYKAHYEQEEANDADIVTNYTMLPTAVAQSFSGGMAIRYALPVLWMTSHWALWRHVDTVATTTLRLCQLTNALVAS